MSLIAECFWTAWETLLFFVNDLLQFAWQLIIYMRNQLIRKKVVPQVANPLLLKSATQLAKDIRSRVTSSEEVVEAYIERIKEVNPIVNAIVESYFDEAREKAKQADKAVAEADPVELEQLAIDKPLLGVPFTCKDHMDVQGTLLTLGSWNFREQRCEKTGTHIGIMLNAGGILLAKTNQPEMVMWSEPENVLNGITHNPYDSRRNPGGSSSGEGALLGAAASVIGIGSDIGGSIRIPSALCGIYGLKPSPGAIPVAEFGIPNKATETMATFGPMCRYVEDIDLLLKIFQNDNNDVKKLEPVEAFEVDRIVIPQKTKAFLKAPITEEMANAARKVAAFLCSEYGVPAVGSIDFSDIHYDFTNIFVAMYNRDPDAPNLVDLFELGHKPFRWLIELPKYFLGFSKHSLAAIVEKFYFDRRFTKEQFEEYTKRVDDFKTHYDALLAKNTLIVLPGWPHVAAFMHAELSHLSISHTATFNVLGLPAITCPIGLNEEGLPLSVMIVGPRGSDLRLVDVAYRIDRQFGGWRQPGSQVAH